jgi:hypothetical protein
MKSRLKADVVITKITELAGNMTMVAKSLGVSRQAVYTFMAKHPNIKEALDESRERMLDNVESALYNQALAGNTTAMIFFLKTQGKSRGYIERQEVAPQAIMNIDMSKLTRQQLERIANGEDPTSVLAGPDRGAGAIRTLSPGRD